MCQGDSTSPSTMPLVRLLVRVAQCSIGTGLAHMAAALDSMLAGRLEQY